MMSTRGYTFLALGTVIFFTHMVQCIGFVEKGISDDWSNWWYSAWNCKWTRSGWVNTSDCRYGSRVEQTMDCNCTTEPWNDWKPISLNPCEEARSRGEIQTIVFGCDKNQEFRRRKRQLPTQAPSPVFDCYETRPCENLTNLPCVDSPTVQALASLCASNLSTPTDERIRKIGKWGALCGDELNAIECLQNFTECETSEAHALLPNTTHCFYAEMCDVGSLKPEIQMMLDDAAFDPGAIDAIDFGPCLELVNSESNPALQEQLTLAALSCMRDLIENAGLTGPNNELARLMAQFLINCAAKLDDLGPTSEFYDFTSGRCTMRLYGDPHVETCNDTSRQTTCAAPGLRTYLNLFFITITGVNTQWRATSRVTVLTEVTIEFKSLIPPHALTARYKAANSALPTGFEFKANSISAIDRVLLNHLGTRVELIWPHTGVIIIINNWGGAIYQFTMRASQAVMNTGTGILIEGCPPGHALLGRRKRSILAGISKRDETSATALAACLAARIPPDIPEMDACITDVIISNDTAIADATAMAIVDKDTALSKDPQAIRDAGVWSINILASVDGGWTSWGKWTRSRTCTNPAPENGGANCVGDAIEMAGPGGCPVDGGWTVWSPWICNVTCGSGTAYRKRTCMNPPPHNGGADCVGATTEAQLCSRGACPLVILEGPEEGRR